MEHKEHLDAHLWAPDPKTQWRHANKGGLYQVTGISQGSGTLHGYRLVSYRSMIDQGVYSRLLEEWHDKMRPA